jgi:hypothetical protein
MNSLWLERMSAYRTTSFALVSAKALLEIKDGRRVYLLKKYYKNIPYFTYIGADT